MTSEEIPQDTCFDIFPYKKLREPQRVMIQKIWDIINEKKNILINAPTGIGKTAGSIVPTLKYIIDYNKTAERDKKLKLFFLTSTNSHHIIVVDTLKSIKGAKNLRILNADILGRRWMCFQDKIDKLSSSEFNTFCKSLKDERKCDFYLKTRDNKEKLSTAAVSVINKLKASSPVDNAQIINYSYHDKLCPYEIATELAKNADVIVCDYYYLFNPSIRDLFLGRLNHLLENSIIIVDEAHNFVKRMRNLFNSRISTFGISMAIKEAKKFGFNHETGYLIKINDILNSYLNFFDSLKEELQKSRNFSSSVIKDNEAKITKDEFMDKVSEIADYDDIVTSLISAGEKIRKQESKSFVASIGEFLNNWTLEEQGFIRIVKSVGFKSNDSIIIEKDCLDPSSVVRSTINECYSTIFMSATLTPLPMYRDLIGLNAENSEMVSFDNPFPKENRLNLIIPRTTTKYSKRSRQQYRDIANICYDLLTNANVNSAIFLPSYALLDIIGDELESLFKTSFIKKKIIREQSGLNQTEKNKILGKFKEKSGLTLLAVASGSFSEGINLPGKALQLVIVVGLPLATPDLKTKELIKYYNSKFNKGLLYGYIYPAMTKVIQAAGRCIRSEKDKGVLVFLDERYSWDTYLRLFPSDWKMDINATNYAEVIRNFF